MKKAAAIIMAVMMMAFTAYAEDNPYKTISMTEKEADELEMILSLEAQDEPFEGQMAVVEVIFNRVLSDRWPNTVHGVLSQKGQFATWKYLDHPYNTPNDTQRTAIEDTINCGPSVLPDSGYVYFSTGRHKYATDYIKLGGHWFGRGI